VDLATRVTVLADTFAGGGDSAGTCSLLTYGVCMAEMLKNYDIPGTDLTIYGKFREVPGAPIVVLVHCLTGGMDITKYYIGARELERAGYASYRFDFYNGEDHGRDILDCTLWTHVEDFDLVIERLRAEFPGRPIVAAGHSLGGLTILASKQRQYDGVVLWDATHADHWETTTIDSDDIVWEPALGLYRFTGGVEVLMSREFLESYRLLDCDALVRDFDVPMLSVIAGANTARGIKARSRYHELSQGPKRIVTIEGADHSFTNGETMSELHAVTIQWLEDFGFAPGQVPAAT
jgi:esterase/lipase